MEDIKKIRKKLLEFITLYKDKKISGLKLSDLIDTYYLDEIDDTLVENNFVKKLDLLRDQLSYYEPNKTLRKESKYYFDEDKLNQIINEFLEENY